MLLLGLGVFPTITAATSTVAGMEATTHREFCGSCHTMDDHFGNATDPDAQSLAARHTRNPFFGEESCYVCHADYGMFGYALTKMGGMKHVYYYYLGGYRGMSKEEVDGVTFTSPSPTTTRTAASATPPPLTSGVQCRIIRQWQAQLACESRELREPGLPRLRASVQQGPGRSGRRDERIRTSGRGARTVSLVERLRGRADRAVANSARSSAWRAWRAGWRWSASRSWRRRSWTRPR